MNPLETAASELERRKDLEGLPADIPFERMTAEVWQFLCERFPPGWPTWFVELTQQYRICGSQFFLSVDPEDPLGDGNCRFVRPSSWLVESFQYGEPIEKLLSMGWVPFADGDDGNLWVFRADDGEDPLVFFVSRGLWLEGDILDEDNGLLPANMSLSEFLHYGARWQD